MDSHSQPGAPSKAKWGALGTRAATAAVMIPVVLLATWTGGVWFAALVTIIGIGASLEWVRIVFDDSRLQLAVFVISVIVATLLLSRFSILSAMAVIAFLWSASLMVAGATGKRINLWTFFGLPYIALPMLAFVSLRASADYGLLAVLWIFAVVWLADTLAYFFGRSIGGPKMAPRISPNKTWAGLAGAVVGGALGSLCVALWGGLGNLPMLLVLGAVFAVIGQLGDLYESAAKRRRGIKDSGSIIPGHGGVLDRIDALMTVSIAAMVLGIAREGISNPANGLMVW